MHTFQAKTMETAMRTTRCGLLAVMFFLMTELSAAAQYGPGALPNQPGGESNNPAPVGQQLAVPDYIKPGFQMIYMTASSTEAAQPDKAGSAGMGFTEYTVIAVLKDKVLITATNYLTPNGMPLTAQGAFDPTTDPKAQLIGSSSYAITNLDVQGGNALWMPVKELKAWQSGNGVEVQRGPRPHQGQQINATAIIVKGNDHISSNTYNADNGIKIVTRSASGAMRRNAAGNNPYNRKHQSQMQLLGTRQLDSPLLGAKWPDWAKGVKKMHYKGTYTMAVPGVEPIPIQLASTAEITERGDNYAVGKATMQSQGSPPSTNPFIHGPGSMLGYWVHPDVLANLDEGTIDQNKLTRTTVTYQVQQGNLGKLGVFVLTNDAQTFYAVSGYNLQNGALTYISLHTADTGTTIEFGLDGIESE